MGARISGAEEGGEGGGTLLMTGRRVGASILIDLILYSRAVDTLSARAN